MVSPGVYSQTLPSATFPLATHPSASLSLDVPESNYSFHLPGFVSPGVHPSPPPSTLCYLSSPLKGIATYFPLRTSLFPLQINSLALLLSPSFFVFYRSTVVIPHFPPVRYGLSFLPSPPGVFWSSPNFMAFCPIWLTFQTTELFFNALRISFMVVETSSATWVCSDRTPAAAARKPLPVRLFFPHFSFGCFSPDAFQRK